MKTLGICINSLEIGGAERLIIDIINLLLGTNKYKIKLLTYEESKSILMKELDSKVEYSYLLKNKRDKRNIFLFKLKNSIQKKIMFKKFTKNMDIIIDFLDADFYKFLKKDKKIEKITWLHSSYESLLSRKKIEKKLNIYQKTIVITKEMFEELKNKDNINKLVQIYNMIDYERIEKKLKEKINLEEEKLLKGKYFLTVCRLNENEKDVKTLLNAYKIYEGEEKLYIIGEGESKNELVAFVKKNNLNKRVFFLGLKINPYIYMKNAEAFILSSKLEGFGLVIAEALYCGTKVISSNCNYGPKEILLDGEIGELFEIGDIEKLTKLLNEIKEKEYNKELIESSLKRFEKNKIIKLISEAIEC